MEAVDLTETMVDVDGCYHTQAPHQGAQGVRGSGELAEGWMSSTSYGGDASSGADLSWQQQQQQHLAVSSPGPGSDDLSVGCACPTLSLSIQLHLSDPFRRCCTSSPALAHCWQQLARRPRGQPLAQAAQARKRASQGGVRMS